MRMPPFERYVRGMQLFGVFLLGMVAGAVVLNSLFVAQFEALYMTKNDLEVKLEQYEQDIEKFTQYKNQHTVIKSIKLKMSEESNSRLDKLSESELLKRVKEDLSALLGQSIYEIDSNAKLARKLLNKKVYTDINGKDFAVELKTILLVDNVLQIWMYASDYAKPPATSRIAAPNLLQ